MNQPIKCFKFSGDYNQIIQFIHDHSDSTRIENEIAIFNLYREPFPKDEGYLILSVSEIINEIIRKCGGIEERGVQRDNLRVMKNAFPFIFGNTDLTDSLYYLIPESPLRGLITGNSRKEYQFLVYNIDDDMESNGSGVYIFTILKPSYSDVPQYPSHLTMSISSIKDDKEEVISSAKEKGAKYIWYYDESIEYRRQEIIKDIMRGDDYKYQLETYPEIVEQL